jgi:biopolymer transport protein ExbD
MISLHKRKKTSPEIPSASMSDIAFLLLVFFMTTTIFAREKGLTMLLPEKGEEVKIASRNIMQILVSPSGKVLLEENEFLREYKITEIRVKVERELERTHDSVSVAIKVSPLAPYSVMVDVLDEVKMAKAKRISLIPYVEGGGE